jgi:hypothetical protein
MAVTFQVERHDLSGVDSSNKDKLHAQIGKQKVELDFLNKLHAN